METKSGIEHSPHSPAADHIQGMRDRGECVTSPHFRGDLAGTPVVPVMTAACDVQEEPEEPAN